MLQIIQDEYFWNQEVMKGKIKYVSCHFYNQTKSNRKMLQIARWFFFQSRGQTRKMKLSLQMEKQEKGWDSTDIGYKKHIIYFCKPIQMTWHKKLYFSPKMPKNLVCLEVLSQSSIFLPNYEHFAGRSIEVFYTLKKQLHSLWTLSQNGWPMFCHWWQVWPTNVMNITGGEMRPKCIDQGHH